MFLAQEVVTMAGRIYDNGLMLGQLVQDSVGFTSNIRLMIMDDHGVAREIQQVQYYQVDGEGRLLLCPKL